MGRRSLGGSLIGGIAETQEMLDYCAEREIASDVEVIPIQKINDLRPDGARRAAPSSSTRGLLAERSLLEVVVGRMRPSQIRNIASAKRFHRGPRRRSAAPWPRTSTMVPFPAGR
jgi:hypothetical protein